MASPTILMEPFNMYIDVESFEKRSKPFELDS